MGFYITEATGTEEHIRYFRRTMRGLIMVMDSTMGGERVRLLLSNGIQESAAFLDEEKKYKPPFKYLQSFFEVTKELPEADNILLIGGAGFAFPKYLFSEGYQGKMTVVELDPRMVRLARRYFFLSDMERDFGLNGTGRLNIVIDDGLKFLERCHDRFDIIFNDAYIGNVIDKGLMSDEGIRACKAHLKEGGALVINIITPMAGEGAMPGIMARNLAARYFDRVTMYACDPARQPTARQNCILRCE